MRERSTTSPPSHTARPANGVPAAADGEPEVALAREADARPDVGRVGAAGDRRGAAIDAAVPHAAGGRVGVVGGNDERSSQNAAQTVPGGRGRFGRHGLVFRKESRRC